MSFLFGGSQNAPPPPPAAAVPAWNPNAPANPNTKVDNGAAIRAAAAEGTNNDNNYDSEGGSESFGSDSGSFGGGDDSGGGDSGDGGDE